MYDAARALRRLFRPRVVAASLGAVLAGTLPAAAGAVSTAGQPSVSVIVQAQAGAAAGPTATVARLGGHVDVALPIIDGFSATVPADRLAALEADPAVVAVTPNRPVSFTGQYGEGSGGASAVYSDAVRASKTWDQGYTGDGVGVAVIDTGINPVGDLAGKVVGGIDLTPEHNNVDTYGHGTFVAGLIAGAGTASNGGVKGVAPGVRLISVKIAGADGSTDLVQLLAALDFVATTRDVFGTRVVNLSLALDWPGISRNNPVDVAVERVWNSGVVVVTASGNNPATVTTPGDDPYVITAGSSDDHTTPSIGDDTLAPFSGTGPTEDGFAKPDFVAPGKSVVSLRSPGSTIDTANPSARIGTDYFKGSGTSFSAGIASGTAALVLSRDRTLTPNQVKARLVRTARSVPLVQPAAARGSGALDAFGATMSTDLTAANAGLTPATFSGVSGGSPIPAGSSWGGSSWGGSSWGGSSWAGSSWADWLWAGSSWAGSSWAGSSWAGSSWAGSSWAGSSWAGSSWAGSSWAGSSWAASGWGDS